jgi:hypothetical protein
VPWFPQAASTKVAGQGNNASLEPGDWFAYKIDVDLPSIANGKPKKVEVEICTNNPDNGKITFVESKKQATFGRMVPGPDEMWTILNRFETSLGHFGTP